MQLDDFVHSRLIGAAAIACAAFLLPAAALASPGAAAAAGTLASQARLARPVTAYVVNAGSDTVTPIDTATGKTSTPIKVGGNPDAIADHALTTRQPRPRRAGDWPIDE